MTANEPNWESMCRALWWCIELGAGDDIGELMNYIEKFIRNDDTEVDHYEQVRYEEDKAIDKELNNGQEQLPTFNERSELD